MRPVETGRTSDFNKEASPAGKSKEQYDSDAEIVKSPGQVFLSPEGGGESWFRLSANLSVRSRHPDSYQIKKERDFK